jgi:hydroxypyruvate isomerase
MPKFAANLTMLFKEHPFPLRFRAAAGAGFRAVEFLFPYDYSPQEVAGWLRESGLESVLFNLPPGNWAAGERGIAALPGREEEFRASVARALEYALALGTPRLHVMAGMVPAGRSEAQCREVFESNLRYAAREFAKYGRTVLIEPLNQRDNPGYFLRTQTEAHAIRERVGEANLKVQMDFYHAQIVEGDLATTLKRFLDGIGHIQIASVPSRNEPDEGEVNYPWLFRLLDEVGYSGWVGCEYHPRAKTTEGLGWFREATAALSNAAM